MSEFSECLKALLFESELFERAEWPQFLMVKNDAVDDWLADKSIPRPSDIFMAYSSVTYYDCNSKPAEPFKIMAEKRASLVSPLGDLMLPTVWAYFHRPAFSEVSSKLAKLDNAGKVKLLQSLYPDA